MVWVDLLDVGEGVSGGLVPTGDEVLDVVGLCPPLKEVEVVECFCCCLFWVYWVWFV